MAECNRKKARKAPSLPAEYKLVLKEGKAVLPCDFFPTLSPAKLTEEWAAMTVKFHPYFLEDTMLPGTSTVDPKHSSGENNPHNRQAWLKLVVNEILGNEFRHHMKFGWQLGLQDMYSEEDNNKGEGAVTAASTSAVTCHTGFSFNGIRPYTQEDVYEKLFCEELGEMIKQRQFAQPFALVYMWGYYLTMEGCTNRWAKKATDTWLEKKNYRVVLGGSSAGKKSTGSRIHIEERIGRKIACNSFLTRLRTKQKTMWNMVLLFNHRIADPPTEGGPVEVVDIGPYLPTVVKRDMQRRDKTKFLVQFNENWTRNDAIEMRVAELHKWATKNNVLKEIKNDISRVNVRS